MQSIDLLAEESIEDRVAEDEETPNADADNAPRRDALAAEAILDLA